MQSSATAIVVTFNRRVLLERCLIAITHQSLPPERVLIVDNASTDGTRPWLDTWLPEHLPSGQLICLDQNKGGAGGFSEGLRLAINTGTDWAWMMDDDAEPHPDALEELMRVARDAGNIYGSVAIHGTDTSWRMSAVDDPRGTVWDAGNVPACADVTMLPFLGILVHRQLVTQIGLPDADFFIAGDDVEYCTRARVAGARILIAGRSRIEHPKSQPYAVKLPGYTLTALALPPWKRYYDTRNRLFIARKYYGLRFYTQTIPGSFVRLFAALVHEPRKPAQLWAWCCGMFDGLLGIKGKRHSKWGIKQ